MFIYFEKEWSDYAGVLKNAYFHLEQVDFNDYLKKKKDFCVKCESNWNSFLKKPNFHAIDILSCK